MPAAYAGGMLRLLVVLAVLGLHVYAFIDVVRASPTQVRGLPFAVWVLVVIFVPVIGPLMWLWNGRPGAAGVPAGRR